VVSDGSGDRARVHAPVGIDADVGHVPAALLEIAARVEDGDVLDRGRDDVATRRTFGEASYGEVVGLGGRAGEDYAGRDTPDESRDLRARAVERGAGFETERVGRGRVAGAAFEEGAHDGEDARIDGREAGVVQIGAGQTDRAGTTGSSG
jgi:hypothetical protein